MPNRSVKLTPKQRRAAAARRRDADRRRRAFELQRGDAIAFAVWYRCWKRTKSYKPGQRVRVPAGVLHVSRFGLINKQYLCGRAAEGKVVAEAWGVDLPDELLCKRCLQRLLVEKGIEEPY